MMNYCEKIKYSILETHYDSDFGLMVDELLLLLPRETTVFRLIVFGMPISNEEYLERKSAINQRFEDYFGDKLPVISYVSQPSLNNGLIVEVHSYDADETDEIEYKTLYSLPYVLLKNNEGRYLFAGGFQVDIMNKTMTEQSVMVFKEIQSLLVKENFPINSIVRQWNYIEEITQFQANYQNYQALNDARGAFYAQTTWPLGYPAATGIGATHGGILVDFDAVCFDNVNCCITPIDNKLQIAAHAYSDEVLILREEKLPLKATPKFERAKCLSFADKGIIYISGTAAIRGEESLQDAGLEKQLRITMENIDYLISREKLNENNIFCQTKPKLKLLRIYLKEKQFVSEAKDLIDSYQLNIPVSYLWADVCRDELLIEIEGIATY